VIVVSEGGTSPPLQDLLLETTEDILKKVLGEEPTKIILKHLEKKCSLRCDEKPSRVELISDVLLELLGSSSTIIDRLILKNLYSRLGLEFVEKNGYRFSNHINELKEKCKC